MSVHPSAGFAIQFACTLMADLGYHAVNSRYLIRDRAGNHTDAADAVFQPEGIERGPQW